MSSKMFLISVLTGVSVFFFVKAGTFDSPGHLPMNPPQNKTQNKEHKVELKYIDPLLDHISPATKNNCKAYDRPDPHSIEGVRWAYKCAIIYQKNSDGEFVVKNSQGNFLSYAQDSITLYRVTRLEGDSWEDNFPKIISIFNSGLTAPYFRWGDINAEPGFDLWDHVRFFSVNTGYLSTSSLKTACLWLMNTYYGGSGILYEMVATPHMGIDVNQTLLNSNPKNDHLYEVVIPGYIQGFKIVKATVYIKGEMRYQLFNKKFKNFAYLDD